jgi:pimeloyl-ACP methyl ester carboxylesterase
MGRVHNSEATMPYATNNGVRIHYETEGAGPPLLLHCGFYQSLHDWRDAGYVAALRDDYRLVLLDPRGHGASDKPHDPTAYTIDAFVADVVAVLDDLGEATAHYWGYSMGGNIGFALAHLAPRRCRSLVIGADPGTWTDADARRQAAANLRQGGPAGIVASWERGLGPLSDALRTRLLASDVEALAANRIAVAERIEGGGADYARGLAAVAPPMLLYCGDRDDFYAAMQAISAQLPPERFITLTGLNHVEGFYRGDAILPHVRAFLAGLDGTSAPSDR